MTTEKRLSRAFLSAHPAEAVKVLERFPPGNAAAYIETFAAQEARDLLAQMGESFGRLCLESMAPPKAAAALALLPREQTAGLARGMDPRKREPLLGVLPPGLAKSIKILLRFPKETAGAVMDSRVLSFPADLPVHQVLQRVRRHPDLITHYAYVVDSAGLLVGVTTLTELMLCTAGSVLRSVMKTPVEYLSVLDDVRDIIGHPAWKRFHKLPVVDRAGRFLGVVRYKTLRGLEKRAFEPREERELLPVLLMASQLVWTGLGTTVFALTSLMRTVGRGSREDGGQIT